MCESLCIGEPVYIYLCLCGSLRSCFFVSVAQSPYVHFDSVCFLPHFSCVCVYGCPSEKECMHAIWSAGLYLAALLQFWYVSGCVYVCKLSVHGSVICTCGFVSLV